MDLAAGHVHVLQPLHIVHQILHAGRNAVAVSTAPRQINVDVVDGVVTLRDPADTAPFESFECADFALLA